MIRSKNPYVQALFGEKDEKAVGKSKARQLTILIFVVLSFDSVVFTFLPAERNSGPKRGPASRRIEVQTDPERLKVNVEILLKNDVPKK